MEEIKAYFDKAVMKYSRGDVLQLLDAKLTCAGPLLNIVMDGIDNLGGMCYGFDSNIGSERRSVDFMNKEMGLPIEQAEFIYTVVRCGMTHEAMPKIGINIFVLYTRYEPRKTFYIKNDGYIWMNVVEFAYLYLKVIDKISKDWISKLSCFPQPKDTNKELFDRAKGTISDNIESLAKKVPAHERAEKFEEGSSLAACTPENTFHFISLP